MQARQVKLVYPLVVDGVAVRFGGVTALNDVSFAVEQGELLGLIGPNGAGKSTLMRVITGVVEPDQGTVRLEGNDLNDSPTHKRVRRGLGMSQQITRPFRDMNLLQNVAIAAGHESTASPLRAFMASNRERARERALELLQLVGICDAADSKPDNVPLGYLKRLELARALALDPRVLLLDEPLAGLNQLEAAKLADTISSLRDNGKTIVLVEHNLAEVVRVCSRLVVLDNGFKIAEGVPTEVLARPDVQAAYIGKQSVNA